MYVLICYHLGKEVYIIAYHFFLIHRSSYLLKTSLCQILYQHYHI